VHHRQQGVINDVVAILVKPKPSIDTPALKTRFDHIGNIQVIDNSKNVNGVAHSFDNRKK
jgi:hypothetical protein